MIALLVALVFALRSGVPSEASETDSRRGAALSSPPRFALPLPADDGTEEELGPGMDDLPQAQCWKNLLAFDRTASLESFNAALADARGDDTLLQTYLQERLTELIGEDVNRALQVLDWASQAQVPDAELYLEALKRSPAAQNPRIASRLLEMGENRELPLDMRAVALSALETQHRLPAEALERLKAIALDETADAAAWMATRSLGRVMAEDFERTGTFEPYWKELLSIGSTAQEDAVRLLALEMPSYSNPLIGADSIDALSDILKNEREKEIREMAAFRLGVTDDPTKALAALRKAFAAERDRCVRWAIFRFAVRAAGARSLPALADFVKQDGRFAQDYEDFRRLYATGEVDFARIWLEKPEIQPCAIEEASPQDG